MESTACLPQCICNGRRLHDIYFYAKPIAYLHGYHSKSCQPCSRIIKEKRSIMKYSLLVILVASAYLSMAQTNSTGVFQRHIDVGNPKVKGDVLYNTDQQSYTIKAGGYNIWFNRDEFHYAYNKIKGDFILTANFKLIGKGTDPHRKIGWMIRANDQEDAPHMTAVVHGDGLTSLQWRRLRGAYMRDP